MKPRLLLFSLGFTSISIASPIPFAIGTNTGGSGKSEGIYLSSFDPDTATFGEVKLGAKYTNPGFLALHPSKPLLYAAGKSQAFPQGSVAVFKLGDTLEFLAEATSAGNNPCHVALNPTGSVLALANYSDGTTTTLHLDGDGIPKEPAFAKKITEGMGPNKGRQEGPRSHGVYFRGDFLHVTDLGLDKVLTWTIDPKTGKPAAEAPDTWASPPGAGPRHLDFSPDGRHAYTINELDSTVSALDYDAKTGKFTTLQTISTLPDDWKGRNTTAEIAVHPNGKFVYASNRGHDSIAVYARDAASGKLTRFQVISCGGKVPRHFAIVPGGKWLLCAHQDSNTISALPLEPSEGKLGEAKVTTTAPNPICILFLPAK